jgi:uncharacterized protein YndB with AHSA1/START domain
MPKTKLGTMEIQTTQQSITILAPVHEVWKALTSPELVKEYFFGTNLESDFKEGSPITYSGEWQGKQYQDKGTILESHAYKKLKHTYWSSMGGMEDIPENYQTLTYDLQPNGEETILTLTQSGKMSDESKAHSSENWKKVLGDLKAMLEKNMANA